MNSNVRQPGEGQHVGGIEAGERVGDMGIPSAHSSPSPPPIDQDDGTASSPVASGATTLSTSKSSRGLIVVGLIALLVMVAVGGCFSLRGGESGSPAKPGLYRLGTDPQELYSVTLDPDVEWIVTLFGSVDHLAMERTTGDTRELFVLGPSGRELWRRELGDDDQVLQASDNIMVAMAGPTRDAQLVLLDGGSGEELWSTPVKNFAEMWGDGANIIVSTYEPSDDESEEATESVQVYDLETGQKIREREPQQSHETVPLLGAGGRHLVVQDGDELFVVDERLENVSDPISWDAVGRPDDWAYMSGEILAVTGTRLTLYRPDGTRLAVLDTHADQINSVRGMTDSTWLYETADSFEAVRVAGDQLEPLWSFDVDPVGMRASVFEYDDADALVYVYGDDDSFVLDAVTGEPVISGNFRVSPFRNGFATTSFRNFEAEWTAYSWPGGEKLYSLPMLAPGTFDGGYVMYDTDADGVITLTVYG